MTPSEQTELEETLERAQIGAKEVREENPNSYGHGYETGYVTALMHVLHYLKTGETNWEV